MNHPAVRLRGLYKSFGEVPAIQDVDLDLFPGEIHALLGENGAGKTTLMSLLGGLYQPDAGTVEIQGQAMPRRFGPRQAMAAGVGMVHQHFMLVPGLTAAQNVLLGASRLPALLRPGRINRQVRAQAEALGLRQLQVEAPVETLSVGEQQRVEILRVLSRGARVMILDEPTAVLSPQEAQTLFASLERLCADGCAVVLISHKLAELRQVASRLTVMRKGRVVASHDDLANLSANRLAADMVGREVSLTLDRPEVTAGRPRLTLSGVCVASRRAASTVREVDLELHAGEIVGLAGVGGNGQLPLMEALAGLRPLSAGRLLLDGHTLEAADPARRTALGLRYIPEDRNHTGTAPGLSVRENLALRRYRDAEARGGRGLELDRLDPHALEQLAGLKVDCTGLDQRTGLLSGGNIQKLILARELWGDPVVILAAQPTRGLDAWAMTQVRRQLLEARSRGAAILLCSEDLDEVLALSDRIAVMSGGRLLGPLDRDEADLNRVGQMMSGEHNAA